MSGRRLLMLAKITNNLHKKANPTSKGSKYVKAIVGVYVTCSITCLIYEIKNTRPGGYYQPNQGPSDCYDDDEYT